MKPEVLLLHEICEVFEAGVSPLGLEVADDVRTILSVPKYGIVRRRLFVARPEGELISSNVLMTFTLCVAMASFPPAARSSIEASTVFTSS
jgi:hypothetical protein